jgi:hypothetical protein
VVLDRQKNRGLPYKQKEVRGYERVKIYDEIFNSIKSLKINESFTVPVKNMWEYRTFVASIRMKMDSEQVFMRVKKVIEDNNIVAMNFIRVA